MTTLVSLLGFDSYFFLLWCLIWEVWLFTALVWLFILAFLLMFNTTITKKIKCWLSAFNYSSYSIYWTSSKSHMCWFNRKVKNKKKSTTYLEKKLRYEIFPSMESRMKMIYLYKLNKDSGKVTYYDKKYQRLQWQIC